jgi:carbon-monoxide dehydrogenase large subunit
MNVKENAGLPFAARAIGRPVERFEDLRLLRGAGKFVDDLHREGMLHAAIVRSSMAHGRVLGVDVEAARAMPGVRAVYTAADVQRALGGRMPSIPLRLIPMEELVPFEQPVLASDKVRYVGDPLAIVVADSAAEAEDAAEAVLVDIEPLAPVPDRHVAARNESLLFEAHGSNLPITYTVTRGDAKAVQAPYVRREKFSVQRHTAVAMETRGLLAEWDAARQRLTVAGAAKVPFSTRRTLARCMGMAEDAIDMIEQDVGGGFGVRGEFYPEDFLVPFAARQLGRPVKWIEDRRENLLASNHSREMDIEIEIACEKDGRMVALRATGWVDMGAYLRTSGAIPPRTLAQGLSGPYDIPNIHVDVSMVLSNKAPVGTYRGPGRFEGTFFRERLMDMAARDLGIDPVEFRRRNLVKISQMPYQIGTVRPVEQREWLDGGDYVAALDRCVAEFGWSDKAHLQGAQIDGRYHGLGLACFIEGGAAGPRENVRLELGADGWLTLVTGSASVGQGLETVCAQIASDALQFPIEKIRVLHGSTPLLKAGFGAFHSRCVVVGGSAIVDAATHLKTALRAAAARRLGCEAESVALGEGLVASFRGETLAPQELASAGAISAEGTFESHKHTYAYGAAAAHVAVDPRTGHVELLDYLMVEDVGRVMNPLTMHGQAIGGIVQGLGGTFLEHLAYDDQGQFLSGSLADYLLPSATDFPNIRAIVTGDHPSPNNPLGAKGGGDGGVVPVGGAVANAVSAALEPLGAQIHSLPMSPSRIWELVNSKAGAM